MQYVVLVTRLLLLENAHFLEFPQLLWEIGKSKGTWFNAIFCEYSNLVIQEKVKCKSGKRDIKNKQSLEKEIGSKKCPKISNYLNSIN